MYLLSAQTPKSRNFFSISFGARRISFYKVNVMSWIGGCLNIGMSSVNIHSSKRPLKLVYVEMFTPGTEAIKREREIKHQKKQKIY